MTRNPVGDNEAFSAVLWSAMVNAHDDEIIETGFEPSKGSGNWEVDTTGGSVWISGTKYDHTADTAFLSTADGTDPRVDLVTVDTVPNVSVVEGTPAADPVAPDIPDGEVLIAAVFVPAGAGSISASDIHDYRVIGTPEPPVTYSNQLTNRSTGTWYQNTDDRPRFVSVSYRTSGQNATVRAFINDVQSPDTSGATVTGFSGSNSTDGAPLSFIVPQDHYYYVQETSGTFDGLDGWVEWSL
jgi:hypothetical protein